MKNTRVATFCLAVAALLGAFVTSALAQETRPATRPATKPAELSLRPEALRAAKAVAIEKLLSRVSKLKMGPKGKSTVGDFVEDFDLMQSFVIGYLCSRKIQGDPKYSGSRDKKCKVTMEIPVEKLQGFLVDSFVLYKGKKFKIEDIKAITKQNKNDTLTETASGEARSEKWLPDGKAVKVTIDGYEHELLLTGDAKKYWAEHCDEAGRLEAVQNARKHAVASLAEQVGWIKITGDMTVRQLVGDSWDESDVMAELTSGAREMTVLYYEHAPIVEVAVEMRLRGFYASLRSWAKTHGKDKAVLERLIRLALGAKDEKVSAVGIGGVPEKQNVDVDKNMLAVLKVLAAADMDTAIRKLVNSNSRFTRTFIELILRQMQPEATANENVLLWRAIVYHVRKGELKIK